MTVSGVARAHRVTVGLDGRAGPVLAAALIGAVAATIGCGGRGREVVEDLLQPSPTPVTTPRNKEPVTSRSRALEVIRTRIADKQRPRESGTPHSSSPPAITVDPGEMGTASARELGLAWTRRPAGLFDVEDARAYCGGLAVAGVAAWTLPQIWEVETIARADATECGEDGSPELWSATPAGGRGVLTWDCGSMERSQRAVGMANVICVKQLGR